MEARGQWARCLVEGHLVPLDESLDITNVYVNFPSPWKANKRDITREPFGLAAIEALALGKPAIVFHDGGGLVEVVGQHEPRDVVSGVEDLAQRLEERRDALARGEGGAGECRAYARRFDIRLMAERLRGIYGELAHGRS